MSFVSSVAIIGLDALPVSVEADVSHGVRAFNIVGLPDASVREAKERIYSAIKNSGYEFPRYRITINLAPADIKKQGPMHDLAIALSILHAEGSFTESEVKTSIFIGELGLRGEIRPVRGVLVAALMARERGFTQLFVPKANAQEAALVDRVQVYAIETLTQAVEHLRATTRLTPHIAEPVPQTARQDLFDFSDVRGQEHAKRGMEIAASGAHNVVLSGPPGAGKTLISRALPSILPTMTTDESLEVTKIYSVSGELAAGSGLVTQRPFRNPHHSSSAVALVGGGAWPRPGEVSLAHRGVLFLDEWPEFGKHALEHLRQPIEDGFVTVSRAAASLRFPAKFMLVAAMNPCPCGFSGDPTSTCSCPATKVVAYRRKISGPLMDRMDLFIPLPKVDVEKLTTAAVGESSLTIRERVQAARNRQLTRFETFNIVTNAEMSSRHVRAFCPLDAEGARVIKTAVERLNLSARAYTRTLKLARTIADLANSDQILPEHLSEALTYRPVMEK